MPPDPAVPSFTSPSAPEPPTTLESVPSWASDLLDRMSALEKALRTIVHASEDRTVSELRKGLVSDISHAVAGYVNPLLEDNAKIKQRLTALESRLIMVEGKLEEHERKHE